MSKHPLFTATIATPIGEMTAYASTKGLCGLIFRDVDGKKGTTLLEKLQKNYLEQPIAKDNEHLSQARQELCEYFQGKRQSFEIQLEQLGTPFQQKVWQVLETIPYGSTLSYLEQAEALQKPKAVRAVANANGANKISILIPCHRVIGSDGTLTGYGGGLERKRWLLELEEKGPPCL